MTKRQASAALRRLLSLAACALALAACMPAAVKPAVDVRQLQDQVAATERAFAQAMAERNFAAFSAFVADEAVFFSGKKQLHGKAEVTAAWHRFFATPAAPFSWQPETVEVLASGTLALSTGPVRDDQGRLVATFTSIWRQQAPGVWRIVFDKGNDVCVPTP